MSVKTVSDLIIEYFSQYPNQDLNHGPIVDWVTQEWLKSNSTSPRDPWRAIRSLYERGILIKVRKGVYRYDPDAVIENELQDFTPEQKEEIFKRDHYKCIVCGLGRRDGVEIHADHIIPRSQGGKAEVDNGQTLCAAHNFRKKNYKGTESGKRMFIRLYEAAKHLGDQETMKFCADVLEIYERHNINGHIIWNR